MHIPTINEQYDYRMKDVMNKFISDHELKNLSPEELFDEIWSNWSSEFGRMVLEDMQEWSGDELFGGNDNDK